MRIFQKQSVMPATAERMVAFHDQAGAINRLTPPPMFVQVLRDNRRSLIEGELHFRLWFALIPVHWVARHEPGPTPTSFIDRMLTGPLATWEHQHIFRDVPGGVELTDRITFSYKPGLRGLLGRLFINPLTLRILFAYRHWRTRNGLRA